MESRVETLSRVPSVRLGGLDHGRESPERCTPHRSGVRLPPQSFPRRSSLAYYSLLDTRRVGNPEDSSFADRERVSTSTALHLPDAADAMPPKPKKGFTVRQVQEGIVPKCRILGLKYEQIAAALGTNPRGLDAVLAERQLLDLDLEVYVSRLETREDCSRGVENS
jgi:hypothetical protein